MDRGELDDHRRAPRIVECTRQLLISLLQQPEDIQVALMMASRVIQADGLKFFKNAPAKPLKSDLPELTEDLPV